MEKKSCEMYWMLNDSAYYSQPSHEQVVKTKSVKALLPTLEVKDSNDEYDNDDDDDIKRTYHGTQFTT